MGPNDGDDDLIVELDELEDLSGLPPPPEEEIEDEPLRTPLVDRLPDDDEFAEADDSLAAQPRRAAKEEVEEDTSADDSFNERAREMDRQTREFRAESVWRETQAYAENYRTQRAQADLGLSFVADKMQAARQALIYAKENGDSTAEIEAADAIEELKTLRNQIEQAKAQVPDPDRVIAEGRQRALSLRDAPQEEAGAQVGVNLRARTPLAAEWAKANSAWMKSDAKANEFVILQSGEMTKSGWSPSERGFYAELSRRVQSRFPALKVAKPTAAKGAAPQRRQSSAVAPSRPTSGTPNARPSGNVTRVRLDAAAQAKMRLMNLDPSNVEHRTSYAEVLMKRQRREANQGA